MRFSTLSCCNNSFRRNCTTKGTMKLENSILACLFLGLGTSANVPYRQVDIQLETRDELAFSPPVYPSPWMDPTAPGWEEAYIKAKDFVSQLTLLEKVNITTGVGLVFLSARNGFRLTTVVGWLSAVLETSVAFLVLASVVSACRMDLWVSDSLSTFRVYDS